MPITLGDAFEKLRWATHQLDLLRPRIESFQTHGSHRFSVNVNHEMGEYVFYVHDLSVPDPDWGLIIGDCIHNARTALDYVAVRLWALVTAIPPSEIGDVQFPIQSVWIKDDASNADVEKAWKDARDRFRTTTSVFAKQPEFSGYLTTIEQLQPFNSQNPSIWGLGHDGGIRFARLPNALDRLSRLDNVDKHRVPHTAWATIESARTRIARGPIAPGDLKSIGGSTTFGPLANDAEIGRLRFQTPMPRHWKPDQADMKRCFPLKVAFGEPGLFRGVLENLALCLWGVEAVLTIFNPVFVDGQPPLPVTAIAEPPI